MRRLPTDDVLQRSLASRVLEHASDLQPLRRFDPHEQTHASKVAVVGELGSGSRNSAEIKSATGRLALCLADRAA